MCMQIQFKYKHNSEACKDCVFKDSMLRKSRTISEEKKTLNDDPKLENSALYKNRNITS